jgi:6-phosphogluconolactonase/glucosamine-6-phosphate isomerase/deaminase
MNGAFPEQRCLEVFVLPDYESLSRFVASQMVKTLERLQAGRRDRLQVVLSAGRTPTRLYEILASDYAAAFDWSRVELFQMDEHVDRPAADTFAQYLVERVARPLGISHQHLLTASPVADPEEWDAVIASHANRLRAGGGIDLALHGIGANGHVGLNEPGADPNAQTAVVQLTDATRVALDSKCPSAFGVTLGLAALVEARETMLVASGESKADAVARFLEGAVSPACPASFLRRAGKLMVAIDSAAAAMLGLP